MSDTHPTKVCTRCDILQDADAESCSQCGNALNARHNVEVTSTSNHHESLSIKHRKPGMKKPVFESVQGEFLQRDSGTWSTVEQVVDRRVSPPRYRKRVTSADGTVHKNVDGLLSDQALHGPQNHVQHEEEPATELGDGSETDDHES